MIAKIIHHIWLGSKPLPHPEFIDEWKRLNPGWEMRLWTDEHARRSRFKWLLDRAKSASSKANILRLEVVHDHGGIYADTDVKPIKSFEPFLKYKGFVGREAKSSVCNALFGAEKGSPWLSDLLETLPMWANMHPPWGPAHMTEGCDKHPEIEVLPIEYFYPVLWGRPRTEISNFVPTETTYSVHYYDLSWQA